MASKKSNGESYGKGRTRSWTFIVYPDSAPENWRSILDEDHIQRIESPLHDKDLNADNEPKKAHWHILVMYESVKTYEQVKELTDRLNATIPQKCNGVRGLVRYMAHLDNPEKFQYDISKIVGHCGADVSELLKPSSSERYNLIREMINYVKDNSICEFQDLMDYASANRFDDWFPLLCDNSAYVVGQYIKSQRHRKNNSKRNYDGFTVDPETGEVFE